MALQLYMNLSLFIPCEVIIPQKLKPEIVSFSADFWFDLKKDAGGEVSSDGVRFLGSGGVANTLRIDGGSGDKLCFLMKKDLIQDEDCSADKEFACQSVGTT